MPKSSHPFNIRILCLPDIDRPIGGVKQLYRHVEHLNSLGYDAAVLTESDNFRPTWFTSSASTESLSASFESGSLSPSSTILVLPETYIGVNLSDFRGYDLSAYAFVVFNQNAYYSFGTNTPNSLNSLASFYDTANVIHTLTVSEDSADFLSSNLAIPDSKHSRIVNSVETIFTPNETKSNSILWMPRKNPDHVNAVLCSLQRSSSSQLHGWNGHPLENLSHSHVAERMNAARIFLSFGHPEGFGLPVAEAMASGCWVIGYSGGGGNELFRFGGSTQVEFGNWRQYLYAIQSVLDRFTHNPVETSLRLSRQSQAVKFLYSDKEELLSIKMAWSRIHALFLNWHTTTFSTH